MTDLIDNPQEFLPPECPFDPHEYLDDMDDFEMTQVQKCAMLESLWHVMRTFVELGFGVDGVQIVLPEEFDDVARIPEKLIDSKDQSSTEKGQSNA